MKFLITESCLHSEGQHAEAGDVITLPKKEAAALQQAGRGYAVADDYQPPAAKAAAEQAEAAAKAEDEAKAKAEAEEKAAAKPAKK